jgi:uncharacterized protein YciI
MRLLHLLVVRHHGNPDEIDRHLPGHVAYLDAFHARGIFVASGPSVSSEHGGAILAVGVSREELERVIAEDEFVRQGTSSYEIVTINVRRCHPAVAAVFGEVDARESSLGNRGKA